MLNVQKRSEPFFDRKVFFSFCSSGHLKRSSDKLAEDFWPKVQKGLKRFIRKKTKFLPFFPRTQRKQFPTNCQKIPHNIRQTGSFGALEQLNFFSQKSPLDFPFEHVESSFDFYTEFSSANSWKLFIKIRKAFSNHKRVPKFPQRLTLGTCNSVLTNLLWVYGQKNEYFRFRKRNKVKHQTSQRSTCTKSTIKYSEIAPGRELQVSTSRKKFSCEFPEKF